jgi:signal transduction histidine kinase/CheY-like chemotaxis protein
MTAAANASTAPLDSPERAAQIRLECVKALYRQIPNSFVAAMVVTLYMVVTMWDKVAHQTLYLWLGIQALAQVHRFWVYASYQHSQVGLADAPRWARHYAVYMGGAGLVWMLCAFLFFQTDNPMSQALTMCGLYGISAGAVPGNAYHPPAINTFLLIIFVGFFARMLQIGDADHIALGVASLLFMVIMMLFGRVQTRSIMESIRIRFERAELIEELSLRREEADRARARAEEANLAKSQFLAAASHDLRQPLHALGLFSASLKELRLNDEQQQVVNRIYANIDALEALFDELLDISKLDAGTVKPSIGEVWVPTLFDTMLARYGPTARERGIELRLRPMPVAVRTDPRLIERLLGNLLANAIRYTERGGVLLACRKVEGAVQLQVWDTGIGIPREEHGRIFQEFYQIGNPERDRRKGLGLGLAIVHRLSVLLDAPVTLVSRPGHGTVFRVQLLQGQTQASPPPPRVESTGADLLSGQTVIVIDDEASIRQGMASLFAQWGVNALVAADGEQALQLALASPTPAALVIADFRLRGPQNGAQAIAMLREKLATPLRALIITGDIAQESLLLAKASGFPVLHKPVRPAQLRAICNHLLSETPGP